MRPDELIEQAVVGLGYELVDFETSPRGRLLRVFIDKPAGVTIEDCAAVSNHLTRLFAVENVDYDRLEVSSPGLDRPLKKPADWQRFAGAEVELTLREPFQNRRKWRGTLSPGDGDARWRLLLPPAEPPKSARAGAAAAPRQTLDFALEEVREAHLVPVLDFKGRRREPAAAAGANGGQE